MEKAMVILVLSLLVSIPAVSGQWDDCPRGETYCDGGCGLFEDIDGDGYCDHSEPSPDERNEEASHEQQVSKDQIFLAGKDKTDTAVKFELREKYTFIPLALIMIVLYALTWALAKKKKLIGISGHRKIWNLCLTVTFLVSGVLGFLLVIRINYGIVLPFYVGLLYWHVEFGIAMAIIAFFHMSWYLAYYRNMFRIRKRK